MKLMIKGALVQYGADTILNNVNFEIHDNEKIAVVGRNGSGKTTLLKLISGKIKPANPDSDEQMTFTLAGGTRIGTLDQISFENTERTCLEELKSIFEPVYECARQMEQFEKALSDASEADQEALLKKYESLQRRFKSLGGYDCELEMQIMFQKFGFDPDDIKKPLKNFSGGQQTKIAFMKLLLSKPDILLLDEPTNHLDLPTIEWLEEYLKKYKSAVVIVSHDRSFLDNVTNITYEIEYGRVKRYSGSYSSFVKQKQANFEKQEKDYEAQQKEIQRLQEWISKWKNTPTKVSSVHSKEKILERMVLIEKPHKFDTKNFKASFTPHIESYSTVLKANELEIGYDHVLAKATFQVKKKEKLAIIGANGKGKSTLLKIITDKIPPLGGSFEFGKNVEWGYFDQQQAMIINADPDQSILDNFWNEYPKITATQARSALGCFLFGGEDVEKKIGQLSGGERVRLSLCKLFYSKPNLLILDEPTNHMDMIGKEGLEQALSNFEGTVIFVSHDRYFIEKTATCILEFEDEETVFYEMGYNDYKEEKKKRELINNGSAKTSDIAAESTRKHADTNGPAIRTVRDNKEITGGNSYIDEKNLLMKRNPGKLESRIKKKLEKAENELYASEERLTELKESLADPSGSSDYQKLMEIQQEIESEEEKQEALLTQMMQLEEELNDL